MTQQRNYQALGTLLWQAWKDKREVTQLTEKDPELSVEEAYKIQDEVVKLRLKAGEKIIGYKMGLTSRAKMKQMGVDSPIYGVLTDAMLVKNGGEVHIEDFIHPKIEPEIAFIVGKDFQEPYTLENVLNSIESIFPAFEIIDSRFLNFKFELPDVIADNTSASAFVLGDPTPLKGLDASNLGMHVQSNGVSVQFASSGAILSHPANSVCELLKLLKKQGRDAPKKGSVLLAGAAAAALPIKEGDEFRMEAQHLKELSVRCAKRILTH